MRQLFQVKTVPLMAWSSPSPFNLRPRLLTFFYLNFGLALFGFGEAILIASGAGVSPWTVLADGVSRTYGWSIGFSTMIISFAILVLWIPLRQRPGVGTILNALIIAFMIDFSLPYLPRPTSIFWQVVQAAAGVFVVGLSSGIYLAANLGPGPRDGLMTGLQRVTDLPIAWVRIGLEVAAVASGWYLGGAVGIGTLMFAFGVGPCVAIGILMVKRFL